MKKFSLVIAILVSIAAKSQVTKVYLQASGLTCSMCSNAINKALYTLDFIAKVDADIKNYTFEVSFKPGSHVDFDKIRRKVEDAGFSVSRFEADIYFNKVQVKDNQPVMIDNYTFLFVDLKEQLLDGRMQVKLLDKGFISPKKYKSHSLSNSLTGRGIYHVTL